MRGYCAGFSDLQRLREVKNRAYPTVMTNIHQWAARHNITPAALAELMHLMGAGVNIEPPALSNLHSEAAVQQQVRLEAARRNIWLLRNNVGACEDAKGRMIRYGLANESQQMNEKIKSSDLIGITPVTCQCGARWGVFTALECKAPGWHMTPGDKRAHAQWTFGQKVLSMGGMFRFITRVEDLNQ